MVLGVAGEARELVERAGAGLCIAPESPDALVEALRTLRADPARREEMGRRGRAFVEAQFSRRVLAAHYLEVLGEVVRA
jgi:glycosyltransferase involved in cell wall biosynthesis